MANLFSPSVVATSTPSGIQYPTAYRFYLCCKWYDATLRSYLWLAMLIWLVTNIRLASIVAEYQTKDYTTVRVGCISDLQKA